MVCLLYVFGLELRTNFSLYSCILDFANLIIYLNTVTVLGANYEALGYAVFQFIVTFSLFD